MDNSWILGKLEGTSFCVCFYCSGYVRLISCHTRYVAINGWYFTLHTLFVEHSWQSIGLCTRTMEGLGPHVAFLWVFGVWWHLQRVQVHGRAICIHMSNAENTYSMGNSHSKWGIWDTHIKSGDGNPSAMEIVEVSPVFSQTLGFSIAMWNYQRVYSTIRGF